MRFLRFHGALGFNCPLHDATVKILSEVHAWKLRWKVMLVWLWSVMPWPLHALSRPLPTMVWSTVTGCFTPISGECYIGRVSTHRPFLSLSTIFWLARRWLPLKGCSKFCDLEDLQEYGLVILTAHCALSHGLAHPAASSLYEMFFPHVQYYFSGQCMACLRHAVIWEGVRDRCPVSSLKRLQENPTNWSRKEEDIGNGPFRSSFFGWMTNLSTSMGLASHKTLARWYWRHGHRKNISSTLCQENKLTILEECRGLKLGPDRRGGMPPC